MLLLTLTLACAGRDLQVEYGPGLDAPPTLLAVAEPVLLQDLPGAVRTTTFSDNMTVAHVQMAGGYEVSAEQGMQAASKTIEIQGEGPYREQVVGWTRVELQDLLLDRGVATVSAGALPQDALPLPLRTDLRGTHREDGTDNLSLPRYQLRPQPLEVAELELPDGADMLLLPLVVHYYSHNGGWFPGQSYGSAGGARFRLLWSVYDTGTGQLLDWGDVDAREISTAAFSPSSAELEDFLLEVEERVRRELERRLLD